MRVAVVPLVLIGALIVPGAVAGAGAGAGERTVGGPQLSFAEARSAARRAIAAYSRRRGVDHESTQVGRCVRRSPVFIGCRVDFTYVNSELNGYFCSGWLVRVTKLAQHRYRGKVARKGDCSYEGN